MKKTLSSVVALTLMIPALAVHAKPADPSGNDVDCIKKSLQDEINKLDKSIANILNISGNCDEDIVVSGHADLTLVGVDGASITAIAIPPSNNSAVSIKGGSKVSLETLTLIGGSSGLGCTGGSHCTLLNVSTQGGRGGIAAQDQSTIYILGSASIMDTTGNGEFGDKPGFGVAAYGASSINVRPEWATGLDENEPGPTISGHSVGAFIQDGSFLRSDNAFITDNDTGVHSRRNSTIKVFNNTVGSISNNTYDAVVVTQGSTAQIGAEIHDNGGAGVSIGSLSFAQVFSTFSGNAGANVACTHSTSVSQDDQNGGGSTCP